MAATRKLENSSGREYKYFTEISQMMFVFGEVQDPMPETVSLVEDIVRSQIIELVGPFTFASLVTRDLLRTIGRRFCRLAVWRPVVARGTSQPRTLSS